jgi:hypothetical protein
LRPGTYLELWERSVSPEFFLSYYRRHLWIQYGLLSLEVLDLGVLRRAATAVRRGSSASCEDHIEGFFLNAAPAGRITNLGKGENSVAAILGAAGGNVGTDKLPIGELR